MIQILIAKPLIGKAFADLACICFKKIWYKANPLRLSANDHLLPKQLKSKAFFTKGLGSVNKQVHTLL
jgi:hypothetical protein